MNRNCRSLWSVMVVAACVAALAAALQACSDGSQAAQDAGGPAQWLAIARGRVDVEGGLVLVGARTGGIVEAVVVKPGELVTKGQVLATLDPRAAKIATEAAQAEVAQAQAQLAGLRVSLGQARARAPRIAAAAKAGAATGEAAEQARDAVASLEAQQAAAAAGLDVARQHVATARLALDATTLRAPVAGSVVARHIAIGQSVAPDGAPLFELLPDRPHVVRAQLDIGAAGAVHAGMRADVVPDSGGGPVYHATVLWVGQVLQPADLTQDPLERALANDVDCTLQLEPAGAGTPPLRIGQRVLVKFPRGR